MKQNERTQISLEKLTNAIRAMQWDLLTPVPIDVARSYSKKYNVTVVLITYLTELGYLEKNDGKKIQWSLKNKIQKPEEIAEMVRAKNAEAVLKWSKEKKQNELKEKEQVKTLFTEQKSESKSVISKPEWTAEQVMQRLLKLPIDRRTEIAIIILKSHGYKIMQPVMEFKEL